MMQALLFLSEFFLLNYSEYCRELQIHRKFLGMINLTSCVHLIKFVSALPSEVFNLRLSPYSTFAFMILILHF